MIKLSHVSKHYQMGNTLVKAVDDISINIQEGEFITISGASGSGKSTLLHMIGGVDLPTSGKILINEQNITILNANDSAIFRRKNISLIYQFYNLIPVLTVEENIILPLKLAHQSINKKEIDDILHILHLEERRHHYPSQLSGGQQQRTAIARAICAHTSIILADEPTGNLDHQNSEEIMALFHSIHKENHPTILLVTHDQNIAKNADRMLIMEDGIIKEIVS